jgi:hypothetical protein
MNRLNPAAPYQFVYFEYFAVSTPSSKFSFRRWLGRRRDGFKRLQRIGHDPGADDDLVGSAQKSGWPRKGAKVTK